MSPSGTPPSSESGYGPSPRHSERLGTEPPRRLLLLTPIPRGGTASVAPNPAVERPVGIASVAPAAVSPDPPGRAGEATRALLTDGTPAAALPDEFAALAQNLGVPAGCVSSDALRALPHGGYTPATFRALADALGATLANVEAQGTSAGLDERRLGLVRTRLSRLKDFYELLLKTDGPHTRTGAVIVAIALANVGEVVSSAKGGTDPENGRPTRQGWQRLEEIFAASRGTSPFNVNEKNTVKYLDTGKQGNGNTTGLASWCGIFANYAVKKAGVEGGLFSLEKRAPSARIAPGSVVACVKYQHYAIVLADLGDTIITIDGNTGGIGAIGVGNRRSKKGPILENGKPVDGIYGFFALPPE